MKLHEIVVTSAVRTPIGSFRGALSTIPAPKLGAAAIRAAVERAGISPLDVDHVWMGCVLQGGLGQAPARQAAIFGGLPETVPCVTVNKVCGSGLQAVMTTFDLLRLGEASVAIAGGMESMSMAPYLLPGARAGLRLGHGKFVDMMIRDGLWDVYDDQHMGSAAELCARERSIDRAEQDAFAAESYRRANAAVAGGLFKDEIIGVEVPRGRGGAGRSGEPVLVELDEEPCRFKPERMPRLRPVFETDGSVTAANASGLCDGAAALVLTTKEQAGCTPLARIVAYAGHAQAPKWFTTAPAKAISKLLDRVGLKPADIDLYEINEAFAVVAIVTMRELGLDPARVNVRGGAVALGHPLGASGARILVTLLHAMRRRGAHRGVASLCIGGGEAVAVLVER